MGKKNGIALLYLIIVIILMLILAGTVVVNMNTSSDSTRLSTFANNITQIQEAVRAEYILDGTIPQKADTTILSKDDVITRVYVDNREAFREELVLNNESSHVEFVELDLGKLGITKEKYGFGERGTDDVYVVTTDTLRVYYLYGTEYNDERYFSLNSKIASILNLPATSEDESKTSSNSYSGVFISKSNAPYTNNMGIKIIANMNDVETLKISFQGSDEKVFTTATGRNVFEFNNFEELNNLNLLNSKFSATDINTFNNLPQESKKIQITKYNDANIVARHEINMSNYDAVPPQILDTTLTKYNSMSIIQGSLADDFSGIAQVRYEYINKLDKTTPYYPDVINIDNTYMSKKAKSTEVTSDNKFSIKVPNDVGEVLIAAIDKAGNIVTKRIQVAS